MTSREKPPRAKPEDADENLANENLANENLANENLADENGAKARSDAPIASRPCPICSKPAQVRYRPFCSKRCADLDLHHWLAGSYAVPVVEEDGSAEGQDEEPG